jgi:hypothetical protein
MSGLESEVACLLRDDELFALSYLALMIRQAGIWLTRDESEIGVRLLGWADELDAWRDELGDPGEGSRRGRLRLVQGAGTAPPAA